jgi:hypothetical protein
MFSTGFQGCKSWRRAHRVSTSRVTLCNWLCLRNGINLHLNLQHHRRDELSGVSPHTWRIKRSPTSQSTTLRTYLMVVHKQIPQMKEPRSEARTRCSQLICLAQIQPIMHRGSQLNPTHCSMYQCHMQRCDACLSGSFSIRLDCHCNLVYQFVLPINTEAELLARVM